MRHAMTRYWLMAALLASGGASAIGTGPGGGPNDFCDENKYEDRVPTCEQSFETRPNRGEASLAAAPNLRDLDWSARPEMQDFGLVIRRTQNATTTSRVAGEITLAELNFANLKYETGRTLSLTLVYEKGKPRLRASWWDTQGPEWSVIDAVPAPSPLSDGSPYFVEPVPGAIELDRYDFPFESGAKIHLAVGADGVSLHTDRDAHHFFSDFAPNHWHPYRIRAGVLKADSDGSEGRLHLTWYGLSDD